VAQSGERRALIFFTPDIAETNTIKRVREFIDNGFAPLVFGFRRGRYNVRYRPDWPHVVLGLTRDARYWHRLRALAGAVPRLLAHRRDLRAAGVYYARNIDQLALALVARRLFNPRAVVGYEVLDIQPLFVAPGWRGALLRWFERLCLRRIRVLVVSSPGFYKNFYVARQRFAGEWFLLENKLHRSALAALPSRAGPAPRAAGDYRWVVGYFGLIRGKTTFALMLRLARRLEHRVLFRFAGIFTTVCEAEFRAALERQPNMVYDGEYANPEGLAALYGGVDFVWALDLENTADNSRWLLPNRFYEAGLFGVPCLAVRGFEFGDRLERARVGWTFRDPLEDSLVQFFETLTAAEYLQMRRRLAGLPTSAFVADEDAAALCRLLGADDATQQTLIVHPAKGQRRANNEAPYLRRKPS
jgi:succinoglycan biosynthesis protein ExoL